MPSLLTLLHQRMTSLPTWHGHYHRHHPSIIAVVVCRTSVIVSFATGAIASVVPMFWPALCWHCCCHGAGIVTLVALASSCGPSALGHCCAVIVLVKIAFLSEVDFFFF
jgi:hypothetical protein